MRELLKWGKDQLTAHNINPIDAELLLAHAAHVTRMDLHSKAILKTPQLEEDFKGFIAERTTGRPTQYIIGEAAFRYITLEVGEGVLIPRPETEMLVDEVLHNLNKFDEPVSIVDLGAGSGAIAISLVTAANLPERIAIKNGSIFWFLFSINKSISSVTILFFIVVSPKLSIICFIDINFFLS